VTKRSFWRRCSTRRAAPVDPRPASQYDPGVLTKRRGRECTPPRPTPVSTLPAINAHQNDVAQVDRNGTSGEPSDAETPAAEIFSCADWSRPRLDERSSTGAPATVASRARAAIRRQQGCHRGPVEGQGGERAQPKAQRQVRTGPVRSEVRTVDAQSERETVDQPAAAIAQVLRGHPIDSEDHHLHGDSWIRVRANEASKPRTPGYRSALEGWWDRPRSRHGQELAYRSSKTIAGSAPGQQLLGGRVKGVRPSPKIRLETEFGFAFPEFGVSWIVTTMLGSTAVSAGALAQRTELLLRGMNVGLKCSEIEWTASV